MIVACTVARSCDADGRERLGANALPPQDPCDAIERVNLVLVTNDDGARASLVDHSRSAPVSERDAAPGA
jgi:hypothetical protein